MSNITRRASPFVLLLVPILIVFLLASALGRVPELQAAMLLGFALITIYFAGRLLKAIQTTSAAGEVQLTPLAWRSLQRVGDPNYWGSLRSSRKAPERRAQEIKRRPPFFAVAALLQIVSSLVCMAIAGVVIFGGLDTTRDTTWVAVAALGLLIPTVATLAAFEYFALVDVGTAKHAIDHLRKELEGIKQNDSIDASDLVGAFQVQRYREVMERLLDERRKLLEELEALRVKKAGETTTRTLTSRQSAADGTLLGGDRGTGHHAGPSNAAGEIENARSQAGLVIPPASEEKVLADTGLSPETLRLIELAKTAPLPELVGFTGTLQFPEPTLEELEMLHYEPSRLGLERRLVVEAYEARLSHNIAAEELYEVRQRALDAKMARLLS